MTIAAPTTQNFTSHTPEETEQLAKDIAVRLPRRCCVILNGDLGAGKSVMARAIIRTLSKNQTLDVPSPTFTLLQTYIVNLDDDPAPCDIWHFDLYRLKDPEEIFELGWEDALRDGIVLIEWAERLGPYSPKNAVIVTITCDRVQGMRNITVEWPYGMHEMQN